MNRNGSLQRTMLGIIGGVVLLGLGLTVTIVAIQASGISQEQGEQYLGELATANANHINGQFQSVVGIGRGVSQQIQGYIDTGVSDRARISDSIRAALPDFQTLYSFWIIFEPNALDGRDEEFVDTAYGNDTGRFANLFYQEGGQVSKGLMNEADVHGEFYEGPLDSGQIYMSEPFLWSYSGEAGTERLIASIGFPIVGSNGSPIGVFGFDIVMELFNDMVAPIRPYEVGYGILMTSTGNVLYHPDASLVGSEFLAAFGDSEKVRAALAAVRAGETHERVDLDVHNHVLSYYSYRPINVHDSIPSLSLGIVVPEERVLAATNSMIAFAIVTGVVALIAVLIVVVLFSRSIARVVSVIASASLDLSHGELEMPSIEAGAMDRLLKRKDELGNTAAAFQQLTDALKEIVMRIKLSAEEVSSGSSQITESSVQLSGAANEQAASTEEVSSSMEQMAANIAHSMENVETTNRIARGSAESAEKGLEAMRNAVQSMNEIVGKIGIVQEIARQTNLLALNAAIEAARAGDAGRGFAVVAQEVRKLAARSETSAKEISELSARSLQTVGTAGDLIEKVVPDIQKTADLVQEVSASSREQTSGVDQVNRAIVEVDKSVQQIASSSEQLSSMAEELSGQAEGLVETVAYFKVGENHPKMLTDGAEEEQ